MRERDTDSAPRQAGRTADYTDRSRLALGPTRLCKCCRKCRGARDEGLTLEEHDTNLARMDCAQTSDSQAKGHR